MRIGVMLRAIDERGGIGVYTRNIVRELLKRDRANEYVLYYRTPQHLGDHAPYANATERLIRGANKALWDQVLIPLACRRDRVDLLFHPKFTAPLLAPCPVVMVLHGSDWFIPEHAIFYRALDVRYIRLMMPLYCRRCAALISVSKLCTEDFCRILRIPEKKIRTIYLAPARQFRPISDPSERERIRKKYGLPERFLLTLSGYDRGVRKNIGGILKAYPLIYNRLSIPLVVGGRQCERFRAEFGIPSDGYGRHIIFPGWIDQADLPAVYSLASLYLYPSHLEAFPIPLTEAMACGTPIVTSDRNGLREIAGDAAYYVNPNDPVAIAEGALRVLTDTSLRDRLLAAERERATLFSWDRTARETWEVLTAVGSRTLR